MALTYAATPQQIAERITAGLNGEIERRIKVALTAQAQPIIDAMAKELALQIKGVVQGFHQASDNKVVMTLVLNNDAIEISEGIK